MARRAIARAVMWSLPLVAIAVALFVWLTAGRYIGTDNAYVKGDRVYVATELSGPIVEVPVQENQRVSRGQLLFRLDDQPYRLALAKIDAEIETQRAEIRGLRAQWRTKREEIKAALSQQVYARPTTNGSATLPNASSPRRRSSRRRAWPSTSRASASRRPRRT